LGKDFPCLQPPSAFSVTPSSGVATPQRPVGRRTGTRADATLCGGVGRLFEPVLIFLSRYARNLSGQLVADPVGLAQGRRPACPLRSLRSRVGRIAPLRGGSLGARRMSARRRQADCGHWSSLVLLSSLAAGQRFRRGACVPCAAC